MNLLSTLQRSGGIDALARQAGVPPASALAGARTLLPILLAGFRDHPGGIDGLLGLLGSLGEGELAAEVMRAEQSDAGPGIVILEEIFGGAESIRRLAASTADAAGVEATAMERMMPILAMLVGGYVSAKVAQTAAGTDWLQELLNSGGGLPAVRRKT